jgi:hypothetical protein
MRLAVLLGCVSTIGLLAAGCGGGDEGGDPKEFARQGNAVCVEGNTKAGSEILAAYASPKLKKAKSEREAINLEVNVFVPILIRDAETQLAGIDSLDMPSGDDEEVEAILNAYKRWLKKAEVTPLQVVLANDIFNDARKMSREYGLVKCADTPYEEPYVHG